MTDVNLHNLKVIYARCIKIVPILERCIYFYKRFFSRLIQNSPSLTEIKAIDAQIRSFIALVEHLNYEFHKYFQPLPYDNAWFQENEMEILLTLAEIAVKYKDIVMLQRLISAKLLCLTASTERTSERPRNKRAYESESCLDERGLCCGCLAI